MKVTVTGAEPDANDGAHAKSARGEHARRLQC